MIEILDWLKPIVEMYGGKYGFVVQVITIMGTFRLIMKPVMTALNEVANVTKFDWDNRLLKKVEENKIYKYTGFVLDWVLSIKLPKKKN